MESLHETGLLSRVPGSKATQKTAPCPISFQEQEVEETMTKMLEQQDMDRRMYIVREIIAIGTDGWGSFERYDGVVAEANEMEAKALSYAESQLERDMTEQHWPFDDFDEDG
ncbi:hypothetical protein LTR62_002250 [Meristemomyces frigidus]|uniref:Uncharacterized protein n=1 Tax=Meristemomyces frigidus TaxID=1508187 RepID=A0AAN7TRM8_9PEZI|nr:hypothetical protein LTR62_002250 [Meristemomyces frigidus]